jgi:5-formyltetrahydrofolate cyclo-ligase
MIKKDIREKYKALRLSLPNTEREKRSALIAENFSQHFNPAGKSISCFVPIDRFHEINTWLILDQTPALFYLPVIDADNNLRHILYEGKDKLKKNSWGILEPQSGQEIKACELDIVLVPLLAIDDKGFRVGYGKGYYDRFLKGCKPDCLFIGLHYFDQFETIEDVHAADIALHYCITPERLIDFRK